MQRFVNSPDQVVEEFLQGFTKAHSDIVMPTGNLRVIKSTFKKTSGDVGIITGGGSGHEPAFIGYVGKNLVDVVAVGEIFSSPSAKNFAEAMREADNGAGVACLYGNYAGDNMNVKMAIKKVEKEGITVKTVVANDDVASAPKNEKEKRRGVAGEILMWKVAGAAVSYGYSLDNVISIAQKAINNTLSIGIGLSSCTIPDVGHPNFHIEPGNMEVGIGHHGEPGISVEKLLPARDVAKKMLEQIYKDELLVSGDDVFVLISGLGSTPNNELYILYNEVVKLLKKSGITVFNCLIGDLFTSLEMMGASLTIMKLDDELKKMLNASCQSVALTVNSKDN